MPKHVTTDVGASIRAVRVARGVSLRDLARRVGVSPATVSGFERGLTPLTVDRLTQVARALDVRPTDLLTTGSAVPDVHKPAVGGLLKPPAERTDWRDFEGLVMHPILSAATVLFVAQGFHATSMRELAARTGMSVAGVYHYYPSKERILVALLDLTMNELQWRLAAARAESDDPLIAYRLMVESLALFHAVRGDLAFIGASEMRGLGPVEWERVTALRDEVQHSLDQQASDAVRTSVLPALSREEIRIATRATATMCTSLSSWFRLDGPVGASDVAARYADYAVALLSGVENSRQRISRRPATGSDRT